MKQNLRIVLVCLLLVLTGGCKKQEEGKEPESETNPVQEEKVTLAEEEKTVWESLTGYWVEENNGYDYYVAFGMENDEPVFTFGRFNEPEWIGKVLVHSFTFSEEEEGYKAKRYTLEITYEDIESHETFPMNLVIRVSYPSTDFINILAEENRKQFGLLDDYMGYRFMEYDPAGSTYEEAYETWQKR